MIRTIALAAVAATVALSAATPASAQQRVKHMKHSTACSQMDPNCRADSQARYTDRDQWGNTGWRDSNAAFWPADVAAGVVGGAVGAAGAIATAPFRAGYDAEYGWNEPYGWNQQPYSWNQQSYAQRNGFVCQPGTTFRGEDGLMHLCQ
jgi:opacity protein-like surface antigen